MFYIFFIWVMNLVDNIDLRYPHIRELREEHDLSQAEVAKVLNCSQVAYSYYELGRRDIPSDVLIKLAKFYKCSTDYLLGLTDER